ncbi:MAG: SAM-dependent methyltransferase [Rhodospirillaceae bacterium]|nr:SAM-dependent methyltransferase [Rhodospirillaceae bacterium]
MSSIKWSNSQTKLPSEAVGEACNPNAIGRATSLTLWTRIAFFVLRQLRRGTLVVELWDGQRFEFVGPEKGPCAEVRLAQPSVPRDLLLGGDLAFAESYMAGESHTPDLGALTELFALNLNDLAQAIEGRWFGRLIRRVRHFSRRNSKFGSRRNISHHYDIGNGFYARWLDPTMSYSAAIFDNPEEDLTQAQIRKYRRLANLLDLQPGQTVLEIGCGWGEFARLLAREYSVKVVGITLSAEQRQEAQQRVFKDGLGDKIEIRLQDYRDVSETYDHVASIEMLEAVGESFWPIYFEKLRQCLARGGRAALQVITINDAGYESYRCNPDFIQKYIFPGGMLPSPSRLNQQFLAASLTPFADDGFGDHYARTLAIWRRKFLESWPVILDSGFDERFRRMWEYYLAYCEGGFLAGHIDVRQIGLKHAE